MRQPKPQSMRQLVLVHGRAQEAKDPTALKTQWLGALRNGLAKSQLELPIKDSDVRFPYYGDALFGLVHGSPEQAAAVLMRGHDDDTAEIEFVQSILHDIRTEAGVTDAQVTASADPDAIAKGPLNWPWIRAICVALDRNVPLASSASIALFTVDVYRYLRNIGIRDRIESGVRPAFQLGVPTVVVGHSLGTVVSYCLLRREGNAKGWNVPLFVTLGSPLAVGAIKQDLMPLGNPECVARWFNAMDPLDIVALYPLCGKHFPIEPAIDNKTDVVNSSPNHHGIADYLGDREVARRIYDALTAT